MKTVILAGGRGTRLAEETTVRPKPMVEIGDRPILWHLLQLYSSQGFKEFVLALGYKGEMIKEYFLNVHALSSDLTLDLGTGKRIVHHGPTLDWRLHLVDTGQETQTGGRIKRLREWVGDEPFMLTYGDGLADVDLRALLDFHRGHGKLATVTAVRPPARFGGIHFDGDNVVQFLEKPQTGEGWINGGFFVLEPAVLDYIEGDDTVWERAPLERLAREGQLCGFRHDGFFQPMDTIREKLVLESLWASGKAPWSKWG
jgi:glucose-1-phosphate cytidylyltransferase